MKSNKSDKQIIEAIKNMPKVMDNRNKEELFQRISSERGNKFPQTNKIKKLVPILSVLGTITVLLILFPFIINSNYFSNDDLSSSEMDNNNSIENFVESSDEDTDSTLQDYGEESETNVKYNSNVIQAIEEGSAIVHGAIADEQMQYVIPISFVVFSDAEKNMYYSNMGEYIKASEWGVGDYLLENASFSVDEVQQEVVINFPNDFSIISGAQASIFEQMLLTMFEPLEVDKIILESSNGQGANLGSIGELDEIQVPKINKASYKRIETPTNYQFLIPISLEDDSTIREALEDMKAGVEEFNAYQTIPDEIDFTVDTNNDQLIFVFNDDASIVDDQQHITMIEAILMTAKGYGFTSVFFDNSPINKIGKYAMSQPIRVPQAVNPIE